LPKQNSRILIAEDDPEDCILIKEALEECHLTPDVTFVADGEELLARLRDDDNLPGLIILDLNMPKKDGREALRDIKANAALNHIPIVILSTSNIDDDVVLAYSMGVNSFITKPAMFASLVDIMSCLIHYWFDVVELPNNPSISRLFRTSLHHFQSTSR
jgi:CheY-like chemotaxis protein